MKILLFALSIVLFLFLSSCKKEYSCEGCIPIKIDTIHTIFSVEHEGLPNTWVWGNTILNVGIDKTVPVDVTFYVSYTLGNTQYFDSVIIRAGQNVASTNGMSSYGWRVYTGKIISITPNRGKDWVLKY